MAFKNIFPNQELNRDICEIKFKLSNIVRMKKNLLIALLLLSISAFGQTTQDEYNYLSKEYKILKDSFPPMKKGYSFVAATKALTAFGDTVRNVSFYGLLRKGQTKPVATLMTYNKANGQTSYFCIPTLDAPKNIWLQTFEAVGNAFKDDGLAMQTIIWGLMRLSSEQTGK